MAKSIFIDLVKKYFKKVASKYYEKINGSKTEPKYLHDQMLTEEYSADMTYESISGNFTRVTADVVSFDSPMPLKSRGRLKSAQGSIPKMGLKFVLNEKQMNTLGILRNAKGRMKDLLKKIFDDTGSCIYGIKERVEEAFLIGFSSGITIIKDESNVGHGIRINYDIPGSNQYGVTSKWNESDAKPIDDIRQLLKGAKAKGESPDTIWMDSNTVDNLSNNTQVKQQFAFILNFTGTNIPILDENQLSNVLKRKLKLNLKVVDRSFRHEKDGKITVTQGWTPDMVVFTTGTNVGSLVYSTLAEENFPQNGVAYTKPNNYILLSKSGTTDPVSEKTAGQALVIPVLQNVDSLFYLNTAEAEVLADADNPDEGGSDTDVNITIWGTSLTKATVISKYNELADVDAPSDVKDGELIDLINKLSNEEEDMLKEELGIS